MAEQLIDVRPYYDVSTPLLKVSKGCSHGKCRFCSIYPERFQPIPIETINAQLDELALKATATTRRIYLAGGNPFVLPLRRLEEIFDAVEAKIPTVTNYGGFCRVSDVARKSDGDLKRMAERGVDRISIGAESGCDDTLAFMRKGHTAQDIAEQGQRLNEAGITFALHYLAGLAGHEKGQKNAIESAASYSAAGPAHICIFTLSPTKTWPLADDIASGAWVPSGEVEVAREIQTFVKHLTCETSIIASHDTNIIKFEGIIPEKQAMIDQLLENRIGKMNEGAAAKLRELIFRSKWQN